MAKSKLHSALDSHQGRDYKLEKQKKLQKQAAKKKKSKAPTSDGEEKENIEALTNGKLTEPELESEGWESDESEAAEDTVVRRIFWFWPPNYTDFHRLIPRDYLIARATAVAA